LTELSDEITLSTTSNLPNLEYAVVDLNLPATNNSGPAIIGIDPDGQIIPEELDIDSTTMIEIFPIAYDLAAIQETLDDILKGTFFPPFNIPCCSVAQDICDQLNDAGIFCGNDFTSLSQGFALISADTNDLFSVMDFIDGLDSINMQLADPSIPAECGGGDTICYAYGVACPFDVITLPPLITFSAPQHMADTIVIADSIQSTAIIGPGLDVEYLFGIEVLLMNGFETQLTGEFLADPGTCD